MSKDLQPSVMNDLFPLPAGIRLRTRTFGKNSVSDLMPTGLRKDQSASSEQREPFKILLVVDGLGLKVLMQEREDGHLLANVHCRDISLLNRAAAVVGLVGTKEFELISKTIPFDVAEGDGCAGSADFGTLTAAVEKLGEELSVVAYLVE